MNLQAVRDYFATTPHLAELCSQNGWPEPESLRVEILKQTPTEVVCAVRFNEVIMEGAGCEAGRLACWGRYRLTFDTQGKVLSSTLEMGNAP
jgi:hypothetical protein